MSKQHDPTLALRVAILAGGSSAEAQVSRNSAAQIEQALVDSGHKTQGIELNDHCVQALLTMQPDVVFPALDLSNPRSRYIGQNLVRGKFFFAYNSLFQLELVSFKVI